VKLSVVIPALDEASNLARLLPDLDRACPGAELLVVDGGSRDGTAAVVAGRPGVRLVPGARGRARQMNAGARGAAGDVLLFLHADTWLPDGATALIEGALADPAVVGGRFDVRFDSSRHLMKMIAWFMNGSALKGATYLTPQNAGDPAWAVVGAGDVNGDGKPDLLWRRVTDGGLAVWYMNGTTASVLAMITWSNAPLEWSTIQSHSSSSIIWRRPSESTRAARESSTSRRVSPKSRWNAQRLAADSRSHVWARRRSSDPASCSALTCG